MSGYLVFNGFVIILFKLENNSIQSTLTEAIEIENSAGM